MIDDPHAEPPMLDEQEELRASMNKDYVALALGHLALAAKSFRIAGFEDVATIVERAKAKTEQALRDPTERVM